jgi:thioredoxin reductase
LSKRVTIYTNGNHELGDALNAMISAAPQSASRFILDNRKILRVEKQKTGNAAVTVFFDEQDENRHQATESFLVHNPNTKVRGPFVQQLGLELNPPIENGDIAAPAPAYQTSLRGCFSAGDTITPITRKLCFS